MSLILLGFGESLATPEVFWSLRSGGYDVAAFFRRGSRSAARALKGLRIFDVTAPESSVKSLRSEVKQICEKMERDGCLGILPMDDASLLLLHKQELGIPFLGPQDEQATLAIDKSRQFDLATASGFQVPDYVVIEEPSVSDTTVESLENSPVIAKPARIGIIHSDRLARPSAKYFEEPGAAVHWIRSKSEHDGPWIVQRVLNGTGEGVFGIATRSGLRSLSGHRRVRMMNPAGSGSSACASTPVSPETEAAAIEFCGRAEWTGLFMIELLRDQENRPWFMELNGRPWGSMALARRRGLEYPLWHVQSRLGECECPHIEPVNEVVCRHLGRELVHLLFVLRGNRQGAPMWPSRGRTLMDMLSFGTRTRWYNTDPSQRFFALRDALETLRKQLG